MNEWSYSGKRVVIAGCYSGMGEAAARELVAQGAEVHGFDMRESPVQLASFNTLDLRDPASIDEALSKVDGEIDMLFNCAGLPQTFPAEQVMKVNFIGLRHWTEGWLPRIRRGGSVTSITSTAGFAYLQKVPLLMQLISTADFAEAAEWVAANPDHVGDGYAFSKEVSTLWTVQRSVRAIREQGVRMNCILPGPTETPMMADFEKAASAPVIDVFTQPSDRRSSPREQALPLLFLGSDAASYINGHGLAVDGGFTAGVITGQIDIQASIAKVLTAR
ncbi:MAG: SDR family oxidoreductase [Sphingomonadales bacterium]|nr:MAG: SDR family oxidoreductase [Sphingomonadales bacterium]